MPSIQGDLQAPSIFPGRRGREGSMQFRCVGSTFIFHQPIPPGAFRPFSNVKSPPIVRHSLHYSSPPVHITSTISFPQCHSPPIQSRHPPTGQPWADRLRSERESWLRGLESRLRPTSNVFTDPAPSCHIYLFAGLLEGLRPILDRRSESALHKAISFLHMA